MKAHCGYSFVPGDLVLSSNKNLAIMIAISFFGALLAAFCGIGPALIFCPVLVMIGIEAQVATATGMYVTMLTTLAATV